MCYKTILSPVLVAISLLSCSNDDSFSNVEDTFASVIVEPMPATRASTANTDLYHVEYKDIILDNVRLSKSEVALLKSAQSIDTVSVDVYGYSGYTPWNTGRPQPHRLGFSSNNSIAQQCGIAAGIYFVKDVYLEQTYTLPTSMVVILDNNSAYPSNTTTIGFNPDNVNTQGFKASLSGSTVTLQTAAYLIESTAAGQQTYRTYPVNTSNLVWKLKYLRINP